MSLEKHLLQAKAKALAEEEKTLSEKKEALGTYESVSLPSGTYTVLQQNITCTCTCIYTLGTGSGLYCQISFSSVAIISCDVRVGQSSLGAFLDKELLEKHHLLHPTHYIPHPPHSSLPSSHPPQGTYKCHDIDIWGYLLLIRFTACKLRDDPILNTCTTYDCKLIFH